MNKTVRNERRKLRASWFNTSATAIMTAGVLGPIASIVYGFGPRGVDPALIFTGFAICALVSAGLHQAGLAALGDIEE
jgi:hypothetical protein